MKRTMGLLLVLILSLTLCACGKKSGTGWQEQYDLGVRYLSEGNYEEAVISFTAAIEIDAKNDLAYIGRGDAYIAGVLYGLVKSGDVRRALEVGNALSAIKNTILGDLPASSIDEIEGVIRAHKSSGKQDEMIR